MSRHIIFFSSGIGSWATAKRVAAEHGTDNMILLFADTGIEDEDNYRFLEDAAINVGAPLVKVAHGLNVFELWQRERAIANNRMPFCSIKLKQDVCRKWLKAHGQPGDLLYVGIDWSEIHRLPKIQEAWKPWTCLAPMCDAPYLDKKQVLGWARSEGLKTPRLYDFGLPHANCGGGCVRAGQAHWAHILKVLPEVFHRWEREEQEFRAWIGKDVSMMKRSRNGEIKPFTLKEFREEIESRPEQYDLFDWGGCGCFTESEVKA